MITFFTGEDLVSFGLYLLSEERKQLIINNENMPETSIEERLSDVHDSDIANWKEKQL